LKPLNPVQLNALADQHFTRWYIEIDPAYTPVEHVFRPQFWASCLRLNVKDIIRVRATDDSYDFQLRVVGKEMERHKPVLRVEIWPKVPEFVQAAEIKGRELVPTILNGKPVPRIDHAPIDGWRLIGFTGEIVQKGLPSEGDAQIAMSRYIQAAGIDRILDQAPVDMRTGEVPPPKVDTSSLPVTMQKKNAKIEQRQAQRDADLKALAERAAARKAAEA